MTSQAPVQSPAEPRTPARVERLSPGPRAPARVKHTIVGVFAQYIQDLTRPADPVPCPTCP